MADLFKVYDPDQVTVTIAGILIGGFADGQFIQIEKDTQDFQDVVGTDGEVVRSKSNDKRATVTISLIQTSASNQLLSALLAADKASANGAGVGPLLIRDRSGTSLFTAENAWISKSPSVTFDRTATSREWEIRCAHLIENHGSN